MKQQISIKIINLERSKARREFIEKQLKRLNLNFEIVKAVDGNDLNENDLKNYSRKEALKVNGRELLSGEIGCVLSHIKVWQQLIEEDLQHVLVLEDDAMIGEMLLKILDLKETYPSDWEYINFVTDWKLVPFGNPIYDIYRIASIKGISNRTCAYLINRKGAEKLISKIYPIRLPVDNFVGKTNMTGLVLYSIHPQVASFSDFRSDIWKVSDRTKLKTTIRFKAKRISKKIIQLLHNINNRV
ncbi:MAG: glycosyltransferase family 25 protein [Thermodesulfobacteriota bacterium]